MKPIYPAEPKPTEEFRGFLQRVAFALGPLGTGIVLDALDFATFGPVGIMLGAVVGGTAGWILGQYERLDRSLRIAFALCAAAYMTIPLTEPIPIATILILLARFFVGPRPNMETRPADTGEPTTAGREPVGGSQR